MRSAWSGLSLIPPGAGPQSGLAVCHTVTMGRFGPVDGLIMLALQMLAMLLAVQFTRKMDRLSADPELRWRNLWLLGLYSFLAAFVAHILAFALIKQLSPALYDDHAARRPFVALAWALATFLTARLSCRGRLGNLASAVCALLAAAGYYVFVMLRG